MNFERYDKTKHFEVLKKWYMDDSILTTMEIDPMGELELAKWLDEPDRVHLIFFQDGDPVGCVNFYHYKTQFPSYELGYLVDANHRGKGLATEMVRQSLEYAKNELQVEKIENVYIIESNIGSKRVLEKNGFVMDRHNEEKKRYYYHKVL